VPYFGQLDYTEVPEMMGKKVETFTTKYNTYSCEVVIIGQKTDDSHVWESSVFCPMITVFSSYPHVLM
jgi:hypothetical protein